MRHWLLTLPLLGLAACAAPVTQRPVYSDAEFKAEQEAQAAAVKAAQKGNFNDQKDYTPEEIATLTQRLAPIASKVELASEALCAEMGAKRCQFEVILDPTEKGLNAHADGQNVVIYPAMIDYATNDNQLAFVIAHEFAHSIMGHVASQQKNVAIGGILGSLGDVFAQSQGFDTGGNLGKIGAQQALLRYSPSFENEADYIGLYILARAGYVIEDAPGFWRMMSLQAPQAVYATSTHPNNPSRTVAMQKAVAEIRAKQQAGQPLLPNLAPRD
jgi:predicted Zn-dependent protease